MRSNVALIVGAGGVLGPALGREFLTNGYTVVGLRRVGSNDPHSTEMQIEHCTWQDPATMQLTVARLVEECGGIDVVIYNAAQLVAAPFAELSLSDFASTWQACVAGAVVCAHVVLPHMIGQGRGTFVFSGATASTRGASRFAAFASAKFALRGLAQALAREYQPRGVHIAHVVIDGLLAGSRSAIASNMVDDKCVDPAHAARTYRWLAEQDASCWTHEIDLRPGSERF